MTQPTQRQRTLLLVDDEEYILASLRRLLRREGYTILTAGGGTEALKLLAAHPVDVIVSDQRMPHMTGVEFLRQAREQYPDTVRMVLSGYTELQSVTDAINEGSIYKFLTKPWDDEQIRNNIAEAFHHKGLADENQALLLALEAKSQELEQANRQLQQRVGTQEHQIEIDEALLDLGRELMHVIPLPILGIDLDGLIVFANGQAEAFFAESAPLFGMPAADTLPAELLALLDAPPPSVGHIERNGQSFRSECHALGRHSRAQGHLLIIFTEASHAAPVH